MRFPSEQAPLRSSLLKNNPGKLPGEVDRPKPSPRISALRACSHQVRGRVGSVLQAASPGQSPGAALIQGCGRGWMDRLPFPPGRPKALQPHAPGVLWGSILGLRVGGLGPDGELSPLRGGACPALRGLKWDT